MILWPPPQRIGVSGLTAVLPPQGYRITVAEDGITVDATDEAGERYAALTLAQLRELHGEAIPLGVIEDWPNVAVRGVMLDVSRCRVPSIDTLKALFARLASWKINHVELYLEHTFAYAGHEDVWRESSAYTPAELRDLDDWADSLGIELTGQQNCLGHMERWLKHAKYRPLAISPDGFVSPWGQEMPATTADPDDPATLQLARDLFAQLLPVLRSKKAHVGLDEPWELASERSGAWINYLKALRAAPELAGHHVLVWDDVLVNHPELLADIPADVTICDWGYEAAQPFDARGKQLREMGLPFWLCPGTSSWNTVAGRWTNAVTNIASAGINAVEFGADGFLVTDWGDQGHVQHLAVSEPMFAWAAGNAWNAAACDADALVDVCNQWVYRDTNDKLGEAMRLLGDVHTLVAPQIMNSSILCMPMYRPQMKFGHGRTTSGITVDDMQRCAAQVATARALIDEATIDRDDAELVRAEAVATASLMALLVDNALARVAGDGALTDVAPETLAELDERLDAIIAEHERIWLLRNRPGGLDESLAILGRLRSGYVS